MTEMETPRSHERDLQVKDLNLSPNSTLDKPYLLEDHLVKVCDENYQLEKEIALLEVQTSNWNAANNSLLKSDEADGGIMGPLSPEMFRLRHMAAGIEKLDQLRTEVRSKATFLTSLRVRLAQRRREIQSETLMSTTAAAAVSKDAKEDVSHDDSWLLTPPRADLSYTLQQRTDMSNIDAISPHDLEAHGIVYQHSSRTMTKGCVDGQARTVDDVKVRAALISKGPTDTEAELGMQVHSHSQPRKSYGQLEWERAEADMAALMRATNNGDVQKLESDLQREGEIDQIRQMERRHLMLLSSPGDTRAKPLPEFVYTPKEGGSSLYNPKGSVPDDFVAIAMKDESHLSSTSSSKLETQFSVLSPNEGQNQLEEAEDDTSATDFEVLSPQLVSREEEFCKREINRLTKEHLDLKARLQKQEKETQRVIASKRAEKRLVDGKVSRLTKEIDDLVDQMRMIRRANEPLPPRPKVWHRAEA